LLEATNTNYLLFMCVKMLFTRMVKPYLAEKQKKNITIQFISFSRKKN